MTTLLPTPGPPRTAGEWSAQRPEPARFWVRYRPRTWPAADAPWSDLGTALLRAARPAGGDREGGHAGAGASALPAGLEPAPAGLAADTVYLPPVPAALEAARGALAARLAAGGTPVLLQVSIRQGAAATVRSRTPAETAGVIAIYDPSPLILSAGWRAALEAIAVLQPPRGSALVWPLVAGLSDGAAPALARSADGLASRFAAVQPLALDLTPPQRRALAEGRDPEVYDALFHGPPPTERSFTRALGAAGPDPFLPRPLPAEPAPQGPASPGPVTGNRRIAGALALAAELWLRLGRSPAAGQALFQAARWADETDRDLVALAREGNLGVLPALDARARRVAAESAERGYPSLVRELFAEYRGEAAPETESVDPNTEEE